MPIVIFQDGVKGSYYVKCSLLANDAANLCDLNARLDVIGNSGDTILNYQEIDTGQIDDMAYKLYDLTPEEIEIVEGKK